MLQISSGKFFSEKERYDMIGKAVIFSNFYINGEVNTLVGKMEKIDYLDDEVFAYLFTYNPSLPLKTNSQSGGLVAVGGDEIINQFVSLCCVGFEALFSRDAEIIRHNCKNDTDAHTGSQSLVDRYYQKKIWGSVEHTKKFEEFIDKVIKLERSVYEHMIACYRNIENSLLNLISNVNLAYSQLVYSLESLAQNFDGFIPTWDDYDLTTRGELEHLLSEIGNESISIKIKETIIASTHLKAQARFLTFTKNYIKDIFYKEEAKNIRWAIKKSELNVALITTYSQRSAFVHALGTMPKEATMKNLTQGEVFYGFNNELLLTYRGLLRLLLHVQKNFLDDQQLVESEVFNYQEALPGSILMKLAPQYVIGGTKFLTRQNLKARFEDILNYVVQVVNSSKNEVEVDMREVFELYSRWMYQSSEKERLIMISSYLPFLKMAPILTNDLEKKSFSKNNIELLKECSMEAMIVGLFFDELHGHLFWEWSPEECDEVFHLYKKRSFKKNNLKVNTTIELCIACRIANTYLAKGDIEKYSLWYEYIICELSGLQKVQKEMTLLFENKKELDMNLLFKEESIEIDYYI